MDETIVVRRDQRPTSCLILQEDYAHFLASSALGGCKSLTVVSLVDSLGSELIVHLGGEHFLGNWLWCARLIDGWQAEE